jgi:hypothetical protein
MYQDLLRGHCTQTLIGPPALARHLTLSGPAAFNDFRSPLIMFSSRKIEIQLPRCNRTAIFRIGVVKRGLHMRDSEAGPPTFRYCLAFASIANWLDGH